MRLFTLFFSFLLTVLIACSEKTETVSKEDALQVARVIDSSITNKEPRPFNELFDQTVFANKIKKILNSKHSGEIARGVKEGLSRADLGDKIIQGTTANGHYMLVKGYEKDGVQHLLYRMYSDEGLNYHDIELCKRKGKTGIADIFIYLTGENLTTTISGLLNSLDDKLSDEKVRGVTKTISKMRDFMNNRQVDKAFEYYSKLPADIKQQRAVQIMYLLIVKDYDDDKYLTALLDFQKQYPNDPNIDLMMIDAYIMKNEHDKALGAIDRLDRFINTDPFLDFYRALISNLAKEEGEARKYLERLNKNLPWFGAGVLELIANYIDAKMNTEANALIKIYRKNEKFDQDMLEAYLDLQPQFYEE